MLKNKFLGWLKVTLLLFLCFVLMEIIIRFLQPQHTYSNLQEIVGEQYRYCDFIPFTLKPNYKAKAPSLQNRGKYVTISTNSFGLRGKEITLKKPQGTKRILILGDSYAFGLYVNDNETYPAVLENLYRQDKTRQDKTRVEVINAGYADGWSPDEHYAWLVNQGMKFQPDVVVYGFFIGNDIDGIGQSNWVKQDTRGLPIKIINPNIYIDNFGRIRSRFIDIENVGQEFIYKIPFLRESHLAILSNRCINSIIYRVCIKKNRFKNKNVFPFVFQSQSDSAMIEKENIFIKLVKGMSDVTAENNCKFIIMMIPVNFQVEPKLIPVTLGSNEFSIKRNYFNELKPKLSEYHIKYLDLLEKMKTEPGNYYPRNGEVHFTPEGCRFSSKSLKIFLDSLGWLDSNPKMK